MIIEQVLIETGRERGDVCVKEDQLEEVRGNEKVGRVVVTR